MSEETLWAQCRAVLDASEKLVLDQWKHIIKLETAIAEIKEEQERLRKELHRRATV